MNDIREIPLPRISPSPYQHRKSFTEESLQKLADSIARDTLVEPIVVRPVGESFELIAGERRWRAVQRIPGYETIMARVVEVTDLQARRMCAAENMQREDLSAIEVIEATVEIVDAELLDDEEYTAMGDTPKTRVHRLLSKLDSDRRNGTEYFTNKFIGKQAQDLFVTLPRPIEWQSFFINDLPLLGLDTDVLQAAVDYKLNKSQTKELGRLKSEAPEVYERLTTEGQVDPVKDLWETIDVEASGGLTEPEPRPLREASAGDLRRIRQHARAIRHEMMLSPLQTAQNWQTSLKDAQQDILRDVDRFKIILESIKREGGFERVAEKWLREDTYKFGTALIGFGGLVQQVGQQCLSLLEEDDGFTEGQEPLR